MFQTRSKSQMNKQITKLPRDSMKSEEAGFLVVGECMALTAAMRKNVRFVRSGIAAILGSPEGAPVPLARRLGLRRPNPNATPGDASEPEEGGEGSPDAVTSTEISEDKLLQGLATLRAEVVKNGINTLSASDIAQPFLTVITAPTVSGSVTSRAIASLDRFLTLQILGADTPGIAPALVEMAHGLTHCRFEAADRQEDDAVLLRLMALLDRVVSGPVGPSLDKTAVIEIAETALSMACQLRRGDALRWVIVTTLHNLVRLVFSGAVHDRDASAPLLQLLITAVDPLDTTRGDDARILILRILRTVFETAPLDETHVHLIGGQLWKSLAQLARHNTNSALVQQVLELVGIIMNTSGSSFRLQFEFVLVYVLTALTPLADLPREEAGIFYSGVPNRPALVRAPALEPGSKEVGLPTAATQKSPEVREVMIEFLARLSSAQPSFFADLYVTYDCDVARTDMCTDLVGFLCRNAYPDSATWSTASVPPLCLEAILSELTAWTVATSGVESRSSKYATQLEARGRKDTERRVADAFNESPQKGLDMAVKEGLVEDSSPQQIGKFLRTRRRLNKSVLGKFLAKEQNQEVLAAYIHTFDFSAQRIDEALREFLTTFRLPGESQQIEAIFEQFSAQYVQGKGNTDYVKDQDSAFILGYAVIMLNTDQHSPSVKRRMTYDLFRRQVKGSNAGGDFDEEYIKDVFNAVHDREIVLPDEHDTDETFEHSWKEDVLLADTHTHHPYILTRNDYSVVQAVFAATWRPIVSTFSFVFATATDDLVFSRVIAGFHEAAGLASRFGESGALDHIVECLSQISTLASGDLGCPGTNIEIKIEGRHSVIVSDLSVPFGSDIKAQMASITLFRLLGVATPALSRKGWHLVAQALANLHIYGLFSTPHINPVPPRHTFERSKTGKPVGILSALSSYLTASPDTPPEPSDEDVDAALGAEDCIKACNLDSVMEQLVSKPRRALVEGFLDAVPSAITEQKYAPAISLLLHVAAEVANDDKELSALVVAKARETSLRDVELMAAKFDAELLKSVLSELENVEPAQLPLRALLSLPPNPQIWNILSRAINASPAFGPAVEKYAIANIAEFPPENTELLSALISRDPAAIDIAENMSTRVKSSRELQNVLSALARGSAVANPRTREKALTSLQRILLDDLKGLGWKDIVDSILLPDIFELLLKPEVYKRDPRGMDLTRQQASSLVGKVYLHFALEDTEPDVDAWLRVIGALDRLLSSRRQPALQESVEEMLKNVVLVRRMSSRGTTEFWTASERALKPVLPEVAKLMRESDPQAVDSSAAKEVKVSSRPETESARSEELQAEKIPEVLQEAPTANTETSHKEADAGSSSAPETLPTGDKEGKVSQDLQDSCDSTTDAGPKTGSEDTEDTKYNSVD